METTTLHKQPEINPKIDTAESCNQCDQEICTRQVVFNLALGYTETYTCISCLAKEKNQPAQELFNYLLRYIQTRPCYMIMWEKSRCDETRMLGCPYTSSCLPKTFF